MAVSSAASESVETPVTTASSPSDSIQIAIRHARIRWVGAPLLITGVLLLLLAVLQLTMGGPGWVVMLGLFGMGTALASFGANHDTAMAHAMKTRADGRLPVNLRDEVQAELERDHGGMMALKPSVRAGLFVPFLCVGVQALLAWKLLGA